MHHAHHKATMSAEREETYVPQSRTYYGLPNESSATFSGYFRGNADLYTHSNRLVLVQLLGWKYHYPNTLSQMLWAHLGILLERI